MDTDDQIALLAARLKPGAVITVLTGAGVSAASGVPTFRGTGGLWRTYSPEDLATPEAFRRDPKLVWEWYNWRREVISRCQPNATHHVITAWSQRYPRFRLVTQNVDGLHERAGTRGVIRFHGSIWEVQCWNRCPSSPSRWRDETVPFPVIPPKCQHCGGLIRPGVVWFGEVIDPEVISLSTQATECDVFLAVGTSALVYPAAGLTYSAKRNGAFTVEINPEATPASGLVDLALKGPSEIVLQKTEAALVGVGPGP